MSRFLIAAIAVLCLASAVQAVSDTSAAAAQRNRLVGVVRVKSSAPAVDAATVEAKLQQFADLQKIDQTAIKVRAMLAKINAFRAKVSAVHANVNTFTAQLDNTLRRLNDVAAQHEREQLIARQQFELNLRAQSQQTVVVQEQAPQPIVQTVVQPAPQPVIVQQQAPASHEVIIHDSPAPQPVIVQQQPAPQPVIIHQQAPQPLQQAPQYVQYASPARRFVYRSPSVHLHLAGISSEFDALVAQHQLAHEAAALDVQNSIHNLRGVLAQPLYAY